MGNSRYHTVGSDEEKHELPNENNYLYDTAFLSSPWEFKWFGPQQKPWIGTSWPSRPRSIQLWPGQTQARHVLTVLLSSISLAVVFVVIRDRLFPGFTYEDGFRTDIG